MDNIHVNNCDVNYMNNFINYMNDVKIEDVNALANSLLDPENSLLKFEGIHEVKISTSIILYCPSCIIILI